jgi:hypothetical protein
VKVSFQWSGSQQEVISLVNRKMQTIGWARGPGTVENGLPAQEWTKRLIDGKTAYTHLEVSPDPPRSWTLITFALPEGSNPASGC